VAGHKENAGRTYLQNLLKIFADEKNITVIQEPPADKEKRGVPDFKFLFNDTTIGYLENKKQGENLNKLTNSKPYLYTSQTGQ
jgi:hypothetical protein